MVNFFYITNGVLVMFKSIGSLNIECAVLPPWINVDAIPDDATPIAILPNDGIFANN